MAAGSLVSRVTGLLRTVAIGAALGAAIIGNDYNLVQHAAEHGLRAAARRRAGQRARAVPDARAAQTADRGEAYAQRLLTLAVVLPRRRDRARGRCRSAADEAVRSARPRPSADDVHLITTLSYLILPEIFFYGIAALLAAILNTRGHFAAPTWTPILNNIVVIATAVLFTVLPSARTPSRRSTITTTQVLVLGIGTTLGIVVQALGLVPGVAAGAASAGSGGSTGASCTCASSAGPAPGCLFTCVISQVALVVLLIIAVRRGARITTDGTTAPGIAIFNNAFLIFMMAHGIVAVSIMTALMPRLAAAAAEGRFADWPPSSPGYATVSGDPDPGHGGLHRAGPAARGLAVPVGQLHARPRRCRPAR